MGQSQPGESEGRVGYLVPGAVDIFGVLHDRPNFSNLTAVRPAC